MKAYRGTRDRLYSFFSLGARLRWVVNAMPCHFIPGNVPVPTVQEAGWAPGVVCMGAENLISIRIWSLDRPAHSDYWLCCSSPYDKTITQLYDEKGVMALTFIVVITTYINSMKHDGKVKYYVTYTCCIYRSANKISAIFHLAKLFYYRSSPGDCLTLAANFNSISQWLQNDFVQHLEIFTRGHMKSECSKILFPLTLIRFQCRDK
jgi:hypothetical protein